MGRQSTRRGGPLKPLTVTDTFRRFVLAQLEDLGEVTARAMFGGVGLYYRDVFFGIIARDVLYLKVDAANRRDYARAGMPRFAPYPARSGGGRSTRGTGYYAVPAGVLECASDLATWARKSVAAAERAIVTKGRPRRPGGEDG
jgi:DNA transformation protein